MHAGDPLVTGDQIPSAHHRNHSAASRVHSSLADDGHGARSSTGQSAGAILDDHAAEAPRQRQQVRMVLSACVHAPDLSTLDEGIPRVAQQTHAHTGPTVSGAQC